MNDKQINHLIQKIQSHRKYQTITSDLVRHLAEDALRRGLVGKPAVKDVRNKLHQIGGAYFQKRPDFLELQKHLKSEPHNASSDETRNFCIEVMRTHTSTAERLPILEDFFSTCLAPIAPLTSVLDLACGLNPLGIPWMPLADHCRYYAFDIYLDMLALIESFFEQIGVDGWAQPCDLTRGVPDLKTQVTFLLKSIPCLEQVDKNIASHLLGAITSDHILVSFPVRSLGGHKKGMPDFYRKHFYEIISNESWAVQEFHFDTELAFLVSK